MILLSIPLLLSIYSTLAKVDKGPLIWSDEFNYNGPPDPNKWYPQIDPANVNAGVSSCATDKNVYATGGNLQFVIRKENLNGKNYTSAAINTKRGFRYGIFESRIKLGIGRGTWSNFLLFADQRRSQKWPLDGEIDIAEVICTNSSKIVLPRPTVGFSAHNNKYSNSALNTMKLKNHTFRTEVSTFGSINDYHVYTLEWTPERLRLYVNDILYYTYADTSSFNSWPYDGSMTLMFNFKLGRSGDTFAGWNGIDDDAMPIYHDIDYVRVYALPNTVPKDEIHWQNISKGLNLTYGYQWAAGCDFPGNDLKNLTTRIPLTNACEYYCLVNTGCTHFSWNWNVRLQNKFRIILMK